MARQLPALTRLRPLRHLNLEFFRIHQVVARDTEPCRSYLLDVAVLRIAVRQRNESSRVFSTLAGVALGAQAVHRDGQRLMRFLADRAERHGAGREPLDDILRRFHFLDRNRLPQEPEFKQAAQI